MRVPVYIVLLSKQLEKWVVCSQNLFAASCPPALLSYAVVVWPVLKLRAEVRHQGSSCQRGCVWIRSSDLSFPICSLPGLLQDLEDSKADLGITSYGLSVTTLEEVFLAVSAAASEEAKAKKQEAAKLEPSDKPLQGSGSALEDKADMDFPDPKADVQMPPEEQPTEKPYTLIKVVFLPPCDDYAQANYYIPTGWQCCIAVCPSAGFWESLGGR